MMNMNMKKENYFRNFKRIGIAASLAVTAAAAALFVGCADGNSRGRQPSTTNAVEIRVEIDAQNLRLIDNGDKHGRDYHSHSSLHSARSLDWGVPIRLASRL